LKSILAQDYHQLTAKNIYTWSKETEPVTTIASSNSINTLSNIVIKLILLQWLTAVLAEVSKQNNTKHGINKIQHREGRNKLYVFW